MAYQSDSRAWPALQGAWLTALVIIVLLLAVAAPMAPLAGNRFHHDEALYSSWGLDIASGRDIMVSGSPVDKPPLSLYLQAVSFLLLGVSEASARIPSLLAHVISVWLLFRVGGLLYDNRTGLLAALLLAASPFAILFAATAFTDSMMVAWGLAGCLLALRRRWLPAGVAVGLAAITKQQGMFFVPLALSLAYVYHVPREASLRFGGVWSQLSRFVLGLLLMLIAAVVWDISRGRQPGFLAQSLLSYGGLRVTTSMIGDRLIGFLSLLRFGTGSAVLNWILVVGGGCLLVKDVLVLVCAARVGNNSLCRWWRALSFRVFPARNDMQLVQVNTPSTSSCTATVDLVVVGFCAVFLLIHALVSFQVWDRYMLGLVPLLGLVLARVLYSGWQLAMAVTDAVAARNQLIHAIVTGAAMILLMSLLVGPVQDAAASRLPVGGDHGAYEGIDQVVAFLRTVPADTTLYHRWLGGHWRFYLWSNPYDFRYWDTEVDLARQAVGHPGADRYVVFPSWQSPTEAGLALEARGLALEEAHRALRGDGSVSFRVFRIEEAE